MPDQREAPGVREPAAVSCRAVDAARCADRIHLVPLIASLRRGMLAWVIAVELREAGLWPRSSKAQQTTR
jgi:hypothetical protein